MLSTYPFAVEQNEILNLARDFASREILAKSSFYEKEDLANGPLLEKIYQSGLVNTRIPEELGGPGLTLFDTCLIAEQLAFACSGIASFAEGSELAITALLAAGSPEQKLAYLSPLARDAALAGISLPAIVPLNEYLTATEESSSYLLNGHCPLVLNAGVCRWFLVSCPVVSTNTKSAHKDSPVHYFMVPAGHSGLTISPRLQLIGRKAADAHSVQFENVELDPIAKINEPLPAGGNVVDCFLSNSFILAAACVGLAKSAFEQARKYALERKTFGAPIAHHQAIAFMLADMGTDIQAACLMIYQAAKLTSADASLAKLAKCAHVFSLDMISKISIDNVQIFGGYGYTKDYPAEKLMRDAKTYQAMYGSTINYKEKLGVGLCPELPNIN